MAKPETKPGKKDEAAKVAPQLDQGAPQLDQGASGASKKVRVWDVKHPGVGGGAVLFALDPNSLAKDAVQAFKELTGLKSKVPVEAADLGLFDEDEVR